MLGLVPQNSSQPRRRSYNYVHMLASNGETLHESNLVMKPFLSHIQNRAYSETKTLAYFASLQSNEYTFSYNGIGYSYNYCDYVPPYSTYITHYYSSMVSTGLSFFGIVGIVDTLL